MREHRVPRLSRWLLSITLHVADRRFALADLDEEFERRARRAPADARRWYRGQVARSLIPNMKNRLARVPRTVFGDLVGDIRFALRTLASTPVVGFVTIVSLAVGIAAATSVFTAANAFLMRPVSTSISAPDELVSIYTTAEGGERFGLTSFPDYVDLREQVDAFADTAAVRMGVLQLQSTDNPRRITAEIVTGNYFDMLGIVPPIGRAFAPDESVFGSAERVAVISHHLWQSEFEARPDVVGETITLDGTPFVVIGVAPADLTSRLLALKIAVWVPLGIPGGTYHSNAEELSTRADREHTVVGRLRIGVTAAQAQSQLDVLSARLQQEHGEAWQDERAQPLALALVPASEGTLPPDWLTALAGFSSIVMFAAGLVLLVACFNVAGLFLARAGKRSREMAVRLALGASRRRLVTMLLTESLLLGVLAGVLGVFLSTQAMGWMDSVTLPIGDLSMDFDFSLDRRVLGFGFLLSIATSVVFGLAPALEGSKPSLLPALQGAVTRPSGKRRRLSLRNLLVVGQIAMALVFVVGAGVTLASFDELLEADWGINPERIAMLSRKLPEEITRDATVPYYRDLVERFEALPNVEAAHLATGAEAGAATIDTTAELYVDGYERAEGESLTVPLNSVTPGYMEMLDIQLLRGRTIGPDDVEGAARVAVVTESFAQRFWGDRSPIGEQFGITSLYQMGNPKPMTGVYYEIIGVVADGGYQGFEGGGRMYFWTALYQHPGPRVLMLLKGSQSAEAMVEVLRGEMDPTDFEVAIVTPRTFEDLISFQFGFLVFMGKILAGAGMFGLALATMGIYGTVSFTVNRRTKELAIRQAIGALPGQIVRDVLREGLVLTTWGLVLGLGVVLPLAALLRSEIEGVSPVEPLSTILGAAILLVVAIAAAMVPARRALRLSPVTALRQD